MKAITIYQPFATLIAIGAKTFETRRWRTLHRGKIAIHAAKKMPPRMWNLFWQDPFYKHLKDAGVRDPTRLPRGAVVCVAELTDCIDTSLAKDIPADERSFGNWTPGRYAWKLENIQRLPTPIDARGQQGLWDWEEQQFESEVMKLMDPFEKAYLKNSIKAGNWGGGPRTKEEP